MSDILARFTRGADRVTIVPDMSPGYHVILTTPAGEGTRVERFQRRYLRLHLDLYEAAGYRRLRLCPACQGTGTQDPDAAEGCAGCRGEGGA